MQCNAMQCNAMQCNTIQYNTIQISLLAWNIQNVLRHINTITASGYMYKTYIKKHVLNLQFSLEIKSIYSLILRVSMSQSSVESPLALHRNFIIQLDDVFSRHRIPIGAGTFTTETLFIVRLTHTARLHDILNLLYRVADKGIIRIFKHRRSSNIKNAFCGLRINTKAVALHTVYTLLAEEVWNIIKRRCESLPNNKFSPLWYSVLKP